MRRILCGLCVLAGMTLAVGYTARAGDEAELKALIAKAVKARGADAAKDRAVTMEGKGTFYGQGQGLPYTGKWEIQEPDKIRVAIAVDVGGNTFKMTRVVNGDKGWVKVNDEAAKEMEKDAIAEEQHGLYTGRVTNLNVLLKDKEFKFSPVGEVKVGERPAVGVRVSRAGQRDVTLFFDKQNHLLLKSATTVKDVEAGGQELSQETVYGDYQDVGGAKRAMKAEIKRDGKRFVEVQWESFEPTERLDAAIFGKP
jgi:hypothetical protein